MYHGTKTHTNWGNYWFHGVYNIVIAENRSIKLGELLFPWLHYTTMYRVPYKHSIYFYP